MGQAKVIEQLEILNVWHANFPQNKKQSIFQSVGVFWRISMNWRNFKQKTSIACFATGLIHSKGCILREVSYFGKKQTSEQNTRALARDSEEEERKKKQCGRKNHGSCRSSSGLVPRLLYFKYLVRWLLPPPSAWISDSSRQPACAMKEGNVANLYLSAQQFDFFGKRIAELAGVYIRQGYNFLIDMVRTWWKVPFPDLENGLAMNVHYIVLHLEGGLKKFHWPRWT